MALSDEERNRRERDRRFRARYGIGIDEYDRMLEAQGGVCAICSKGQTAPRKGRGKAVRRAAPRLAVDHDHLSGRVRGLLCSNCNHRLIGRWKDPAVLRAAADYLERTGGPADVVAVDVPPSNTTPPSVQPVSPPESPS